MKIKYLIIVSLILAILTVGAVSASEDADNLTVSDDIDDEISQVKEINVIAEDNTDDNLGGDKNDIDYEIHCNDEIAGPSFGGEWADFNGFISVNFYDYTDGNLTISIDNKQVYNGKALYTPDYDTVHKVYLNQLDLEIGTHTATFNFTGDEYYNPFNIEREFEYYYIKDLTEDTLQINGNNFDVSLSKDAAGTLTVLIDDIKFFEAKSDEYRELDDENSIVKIQLKDMENITTLKFGQHSYKIMYSKGKYPDKNLTGNFTFDYYFNVINEGIEESSQAYYDEELIFDVEFPEDAAKDIILIANGKTYPVTVDESNHFIFNDLKFGENNLTFICQNDKYPKKEITIIFDAIGRIRIPEYFMFNENQAIELKLPGDASGNLSVYSAIWDDETSDYVESELLKTAPFNNGVGNISLADLKIGTYNILVKYTGNDYNVSNMYAEITVEPNVNYKRYYWVDGNNNITIESPDSLTGNYTINLIYTYYDSENYEYKDNIITLYNSSVIEKIFINLPKLNVTSYGYYGEGNDEHYYIDITYSENESEIFSKVYQFDVKSANPSWEMNATFPDSALKYEDLYWYIKNIPATLYTGIATVYIDDVLVSRLAYDYDMEFDYENRISSDILSKLSNSVHTWKIQFEDSSRYFKNASQTGTFEVTWIEVPEEVNNGESYIRMDIFDENATGYLTLEIDGKEYSTEFVNNGYAFIELDGLSLGQHSYKVTYSGDKKYGELTKSGKFNVVQLFFFTNLENDYENIIPLSDFYPFYMRLANDTTGTVTVTVGGKTYTAEVKEGFAEINATGLGLGEYTIVAKYSGDGKYPAKEIKNNFTIKGYSIIAENDYENDELIFIKLILPDDAKGNLTVYTAYYDDWDLEYHILDLLKTTSVKNGVAIINGSDIKSLLKYGHYYLKAVYYGEDYDVESLIEILYYSPKVNVTESVFIGEDGKISVDLGNATGNITIYLNNEKYTTSELKNGKISEVIPAFKLTLSENVIRLEYSGADDLGEHIFDTYDADLENYKTALYYIYVELKNITTPTTIADGKGNITMELPQNYKANVTVYVDGEKVSTTRVNGGNVTIQVSNLTYGDNNIYAEIEGDDGSNYTAYAWAYISKPRPEMDIDVPSDKNIAEFSINLDKDATGSLIVTVDGKSYTAELVNGSAKISVPGLADGTHETTVKCSGDANHTGFTKTSNVTTKTTTTVPAKITAKDLTAFYSEDSYSVTVYGTDGKSAPEGTEVIFKINGKQIKTAKTNAQGIVTLKLNQKPGTYKITAEALGVSVTNTLTVKHIVTLKKVTVKKSAKKLVIQVTLKAGKKALAKKKVALKFNGKTYKAKTNSKGVAKFTITKKVLKKLKKGKKITYQATYLDDTVKQTVKVK